jgi:hypothetical protein
MRFVLLVGGGSAIDSVGGLWFMVSENFGGSCVSEKGEQTIECVGCGSKWLVISSNGVRVLARLAECPLCGQKDRTET